MDGCLPSCSEMLLTLKAPKLKIAEFANSVDSDEAAHDELPHLDPHCLPSSQHDIA